MKRTTIFVDEALEQDLKAIAGQRQQPVAWLVRDALVAYVAREKRASRTRLSFVAAGASGYADTAERHEELLWQDAEDNREVPHRPGNQRKRDTHRIRSAARRR